MLAGVCAPPAHALTAVDDAGVQLQLPNAARRIISLSPHATELLFAIGAGSSVIAVVDYSDYPAAARQLPSVGSAAYLDMERILAYRPQLVVAWGSGNNASRIEQLRALGIPVFASEPRDFEGIASNMERLGELTGTAQQARSVAGHFRQQVRSLQSRYRQRRPVSVFYQAWDAPLMTLNHQHLVSQVLTLCGGSNVFGSLSQLAPTVGIEDVIARNPEVILNASGRPEGDSNASWLRFTQLTAVRRGNLFVLDPDLLTRATPRIVQGAEQVCRALDAARAKTR